MVQYIPADIYILALQILLRANRSSPVFFSLRVFVYLARAVFYPSFNLFSFFFVPFFRGCRSLPSSAFCFALLCGTHVRDARQKKKTLFAVETVAGTTSTSSRDLASSWPPCADGFKIRLLLRRPKAETTAKKRQKKKKVKTLNV